MSDVGSWKGIRVRDRNGRLGKIIADGGPGWDRYLDIRFSDGETYTVVLRAGPFNRGDEDKHDVEWLWEHGQKWIRLAEKREPQP